jgi:hypothetical protein
VAEIKAAHPEITGLEPAAVRSTGSVMGVTFAEP